MASPADLGPVFPYKEKVPSCSFRDIGTLWPSDLRLQAAFGTDGGCHQVLWWLSQAVEAGDAGQCVRPDCTHIHGGGSGDARPAVGAEVAPPWLRGWRVRCVLLRGRAPGSSSMGRELGKALSPCATGRRLLWTGVGSPNVV